MPCSDKINVHERASSMHACCMYKISYRDDSMPDCSLIRGIATCTVCENVRKLTAQVAPTHVQCHVHVLLPRN